MNKIIARLRSILRSLASKVQHHFGGQCRMRRELTQRDDEPNVVL